MNVDKEIQALVAYEMAHEVECEAKACHFNLLFQMLYDEKTVQSYTQAMEQSIVLSDHASLHRLKFALKHDHVKGEFKLRLCGDWIPLTTLTLLENATLSCFTLGCHEYHPLCTCCIELPCIEIASFEEAQYLIQRLNKIKESVKFHVPMSQYYWITFTLKQNGYKTQCLGEPMALGFFSYLSGAATEVFYHAFGNVSSMA